MEDMTVAIQEIITIAGTTPGVITTIMFTIITGTAMGTVTGTAMGTVTGTIAPVITGVVTAGVFLLLM